VDRLSERLADAERAVASLADLASLAERSTVERDAAIMRFAYTFEATWKAAQETLRVREGVDVGSPKQAIRASRRSGLLSDAEAEAALQMADDRNLVVHVYRETVAREIDSRLSRHAATLTAWIHAMRRVASGG
jgi:nucleotidyltransferase substrate binding protein (TIGR01987 family)